MCRDGHYDSCAVAGDDIIGSPDWYFLPGDGVYRVGSGEYAGFLAGGRHTVDVGGFFGEFLIGCDCRAAIRSGQAVAKFRLGSYNDIGYTHKRIGTGRKDVKLHWRAVFGKVGLIVFFTQKRDL